MSLTPKVLKLTYKKDLEGFQVMRVGDSIEFFGDGHRHCEHGPEKEYYPNFGPYIMLSDIAIRLANGEGDSVLKSHFSVEESYIDDLTTNWEKELRKVHQCCQRQDGTNEQLKDLITIANRFGFYDAADYLKNVVYAKPTNSKVKDLFFKSVIKAISEVTGEDKIYIKPESIINNKKSPKESIYIDDLDCVEILMKVEQEMNMCITDPAYFEFEGITVNEFSEKLWNLTLK